MKYAVYFSLVVFCLVHSYSFGMVEMFAHIFYFPSRGEQPPPVQTIEYNFPLEFNRRMKIADDKERQDAAAFITCLDGFKSVAEKTLRSSPDFEKLSDREILFLKFCIEANDITRYKVHENRNAVYKQVCSFDLSVPAVTKGLEFWRKLLSKKKIDEQLFEEQHAQTKKLHAFIRSLISQGLISQYPPTVRSKVVYKAAL